MTAEAAAPAWLVDAARMPIAFAQVREDPRLDLEVLQRLDGDRLRVAMIASGGCTAASLAASDRVAHLHLVDVNPAQLALCRLKLHLLNNATPIERLQLLGHAPMPGGRARRLAALLDSVHLSPDALGPLNEVAELGPDHAGRYELLFAQLRREMGSQSEEWAQVLQLSDPAERVAQVKPDAPLGQAMDEAFDRTMALPHLVRLFGAAATQNGVQPFSRHFAWRTRHAIQTMATADNPFLWQLLVGRFPQGAAHKWLQARAPKREPHVTQSVGAFDDALANTRGEYDLVHLSNILDWLSPAQARHTLNLARRALRPGGLVFIRQLNSTLDVPGMSDGFAWLSDEARAMHECDRSFFYANLHLGRRR